MRRVAALILETLEKTNKDWIPASHYPSSAGFRYSDGSIVGPDILSQFLKWTGVKPSNPPDGPGILKMRLGDGSHETLSKILASSGVKVLSETSFKMKPGILIHPISGRTDFQIELDPQELEVIEAKSSQDSMMFGKSYTENPYSIAETGPKVDHILQVICYMNCVPGVKRARFLYIARDTGRMLEFVMERTGVDSYAIDGKPVKELSWDGIVKRWAELEALVNGGIAPPPDYRAWINETTHEVMPIKTIKGEKFKTHWRVMYDPYRDYIWKDPKNFKYSYNAIGAPDAGKSMS